MKSILITSGILILLIAALRPLLRGRLDPRAQYALWLVVALRLLVPVELATSAYSALALLERVEAPAQVVETIGQATLPARSYDSARAQVVEQYRSQGVSEAQLTPGDLMDIDAQARELMRGPTLAQLFERYARPVWLGGAALAVLWFTLVNLRLRRKLRTAEPVEPEEPCPLPVLVSDALPSPCLCGVFRPKIYVTPAALDSPERLRHVLAHELTHYRHRDHWWALVRCACLCLYWFDPLVWWAAALSRQDCELACDEGAIRRLGEGERIPYGRTLVDMIAAGRTPLLQTATTMTGSKRRVRERISLIARRPKTVLAVALALVLVLGAAVGCTFTGAPEKTPGPGGGTPMTATVDTLQERLEDIPEELQADVVIRPYEQAAGGDFLVHYWLNRDWTDLDNSGLGWLLGVRRVSQAELDEYRATGGSEIIARSGGIYYAIAYATDVRFYSPDDAEPYHNAFEAIRVFAEETVLETEGVEPYVPEQTAPEQQAIQVVMDEIAAAPGTTFALYIPEDPLQSYIYQTDVHTNDFWATQLDSFAERFQWERLEGEAAGAALMAQAQGTQLLLTPMSGSIVCLYVYQDSTLVAIRTAENEMEYYQAGSRNPDEPLGVQPFLWPGPFEAMRLVFDEVELAAHQNAFRFVDDREGQTLDDIALE